MTRPKYEPNPPPNLDGMQPDEAARVLNNYLREELARIADWWPDDASSRLEALEEIQNNIPGEWPVRDLEQVIFTIETGDPASLICSVVDMLDDTNPQASADQAVVYYNNGTSDGFTFVQSRDVATGDSTGVYDLDPSTDTVTRKFGGNNWDPNSACAIDDDGSSTNPKHLCIALRITGSWTVKRYTVPSYTEQQTITIGSNAPRPICDRDDDVLCLRQPANAIIIDKGTWTSSTLSAPAGYQFNTQTGAVRASASSYLICVQHATNLDYHFSTLTTGTAVPAPSNSAPSNVVMNQSINPIVVGSSVYWACDLTDGTQNGQILKTSLAGAQQGLIDCTFGTNQTWSASSGNTRLFHSPDNNSIYWLQGGVIYRMNVTTEQIEKCTVQEIIDPSDGLPYTGQTYSGLIGIYDSGQTAYLHVFDAEASTIQIFGKALLKN